MLAESHQGRPTRVEGNPDHPASLGSTSPYLQANILGLYDPDRSQFVTSGGEASSYGEFAQVFATALAGLQEGSRVSHPDRDRHLTDPGPAARRGHAGVSAGAVAPVRNASHRRVRRRGSRFRRARAKRSTTFSQADVVLSLDADFLGPGPAQLAYSRAFAERRRVRSAEDDDEPPVRARGSPDDHRQYGRPPARPSSQSGRGGGPSWSLPAWASQGAGDAELPKVFPKRGSRPSPKTLQGAGGRCVVVAGDEQDASVHVLAHAMNAALGSVGTTVFYTDPVVVEPTDQLESLRITRPKR